MAEELDDGEFWLPPQFLDDDDDDNLECSGNRNKLSRDSIDGLSSYGPYSDLSSPVGSVLGSTETESDEDDEDYHIAGLTRKIAHSTLQDDSSPESQKSSAMAGSPQSTLCAILGGSSRGSTNCPSPVSPAAVINEAGWDLLHAAAGEVARMRMTEQEKGAGFDQNKGLFGPPPIQNPVSVGFHSIQPLHYQQFQVSQFQQLKQQQIEMMKNRATVYGGAPYLSSSCWPTLQQSQQQPGGSGMRNLFSGHQNKKECAGTGVFLPRPIENQTKSRKKPDAALKFRKNVPPAQQRRNVRPQPVNKNELRLPQEWTY